MNSMITTQTFTVTLEENLICPILPIHNYPFFPLLQRETEELSYYGRILYELALNELKKSYPLNFNKEEFLRKVILISHYGHTNIRYKRLEITYYRIPEIMSYEFDVKIYL